MDNRDILERRLEMAKRALAILEERTAGYTALTIPVDLAIELNEKRKEVAQVEARLAGNSGETFPNLGGVAQVQQQYDRAAGHYREALALAEKVVHKEHQAIYAGNLGLLALDRGRPAETRPYFERALVLAREVGREDLVADALWGLARVLEEEGRPAEALPLAEEALRSRERLRHMDVGEARELVARLRQKLAG